MADYHEPYEELSPECRNLHRALLSVKEEIEAVDWYHQRVELTDDPELQRVLAHNRDEEIEHACMGLEWLRRNMPGWDEQMRTFLFREGPIAEIEEQLENAPSARPAGSTSADAIGLDIGNLAAVPSEPKES